MCQGLVPKKHDEISEIDRRPTWLHTNGVNTHGAAAEVMNFARLWEKVRPGTFGKIKSRLEGVPKSPLSKNVRFAVTPLVLTPRVPFRTLRRSCRGRAAEPAFNPLRNYT